MNTRQFFKHRYLLTFAKSATANEIKLSNLSGSIWKLIAELFASAYKLPFPKTC